MAGLIRHAVAGAVGGIVGTAAMDAVWYSRYVNDGGQADLLAWEFGGVENWDDVSAPGQVGRLVLKKVLGEDPPDSWAQPTQNAVHWMTGIAWGKLYSLAGGGRSRRGGSVLAVVAWGTSYLVLAPLGVYKPMRSYPISVLARDLSAHLVYGSVTAGVTYALRGRRSSRR